MTHAEQVQVDRGAATEAIGRAVWHLEAAAKLLIQPCHAALYLKDSQPERVLAAFSKAIHVTQELGNDFREGGR